MIEYERRIDILMQRKIIWRREPTTDVPTEVHPWGWYFKDGTYQCYSLFKYKSKIGTLRMYKWHLRVLWHLNPELSKQEFDSLSRFIAEVRNGFTSFPIHPETLESVIDEIYNSDLEKPPENKLKKIVFKEYHGLTRSEQCSIAGGYSRKGSGLTTTDLYEEMLYMNSENKKITIDGLAESLGCTKRTVHRNMNDALREEKKQLNKSLKK